MKSLFLSLAFLFAVSSNAQSGFQVKEKINLECHLINLPGNTNDSWTLYIRNSEVLFWDNDHYAKAVAVNAQKEPGSDYLIYTYRSVDKQDPFRVVLGTRYVKEEIYASLYLGKTHKPQVFHCADAVEKNLRRAFNYHSGNVHGR